MFIAGEKAQGLFVVAEGSVRAFRAGADGREQIIHVERAVTTVAEVPIFDDETYPSTVAAEEETRLFFIGKQQFRALCLEHPQIALVALKVLAGRLRCCAALAETLSLCDVGQRLARLLLAETRAKGERNASGIHLNPEMTHAQIAARGGTVREVVSRAFTRLHNDGLIIKGRHLIIPNEKALAVYADLE
ncbi:MAG: hypothetical protein NVSMB56_17910 [Pyrinomonadaceae bacterium]